MRSSLPLPGDVVRLPERGSEEAHAASALGIDALRSGSIAHVVLAGGMATRFGGVVKAVVDVLDGRSFLDLALSVTAATAEAHDAVVPTAVMTSFATDRVVRAHLETLDVPMPIVFSQFVSLRLEPDGVALP